MRLPFEKKKEDIGTWSYRHRAGIYITLIAYLVLAIAFISARIHTGRDAERGGILIEMDLAEQPQERPETDRQPMDLSDYYDGPVANRASNENAALDPTLRDASGIDAARLYADAEALGDKIRANQQAHHDGLAYDPATVRNDAPVPTTGETSRVSGNVTVSYSFADPVRHDRRLVVPAYMCESGGQVVVSVELNNNGDVVAATVERGVSSGDNCMQTTALGAARASHFNIDGAAPARHRGTITYKFVRQ